MAELSEAINLDEIAVGLPSRIHDVTARQVAEAPDRIALVENGASWSYRDLSSALERSLPSSPRLALERATSMCCLLTTWLARCCREWKGASERSTAYHCQRNKSENSTCAGAM